VLLCGVLRCDLLGVNAKVREIKKNENRRRGGTSYFLRKQRGARRVFLGYFFPVGMLCMYREIAGGINEHFCHLPPNCNAAPRDYCLWA
jgi:hypothetical protein